MCPLIGFIDDAHERTFQVAGKPNVVHRTDVCPRYKRASGGPVVELRRQSLTYRCLAAKHSSGVVLWSRRGNDFTTRFHGIARTCAKLPAGTLIDGDLRFVGKVRNGFVPRVRREVFQRFTGLATAKCPFANLPEKRRTMWALTADEMNNCRWLKLQIEFTKWTPDAHLRHASFIGLRDDNEVREIIRE